MNIASKAMTLAAIAQMAMVGIVLALVGMVLLTILTFVAIDNSRSRTDCLKAAQAIDQCPIAAGWENLLRKGLGL